MWTPTLCEHVRIKQAARMRGYRSQAALGKASGVAEKTVGAMVSLHSKLCAIDTLSRLAKACGLTLCLVPTELAQDAIWRKWVCEPCAGPDPNRRFRKGEEQPLRRKQPGRKMQWELSQYRLEVLKKSRLTEGDE